MVTITFEFLEVVIVFFREPVKDYGHFNGPNACPSTSDNLNLHKYEVLEAASKAKKELNKTVKVGNKIFIEVCFTLIFSV